jgi:hypothetical protein
MAMIAHREFRVAPPGATYELTTLRHVVMVVQLSGSREWSNAEPGAGFFMHDDIR